MDLCLVCQRFDIQAFARGGFPHRGYLLRDTIKAAQTGCTFCSLLIDSLRLSAEKAQGQRNKGHQLLEADSQTCGGFLPSFMLWAWDIAFPSWIDLTAIRNEPLSSRDLDAANITALRASIGGCSWPPKFRGPVRLNVAADLGSPAALSGDIMGKLHTQISTWSPSHLEAIRQWHDICRSEHPNCSKTFSQAWSFDVEDVPLPTRCIEISTKRADPDAPTYQHVLRETAGQRGRYMILSHRWGRDAESCKTTTRNQNCMKGHCGTGCRICQGSVPEMTRLFQDAARLSAEMGLQYLWVDSICIIQDSADDWSRESVKMASYYQHAWMTICATVVSTNNGLFGPISDEYWPRVTRLPYRDSNATRRGHFYLQCLQESFVSSDFRTNIGMSELLQRGWVFQEWMLSRRKLTFSGMGGLFVQCQEESPKSLFGDTATSGTEKDLASGKHTAIDISSTTTVLESWLYAVENYSGLKLTSMEKDRLVALSGLADEFNAAIQSCQATEAEKTCYYYISGLWFNFSRGLLWEQSTSGKRARVRGLPTWSWASMGIADDGGGPNCGTGTTVRWQRYPDGAPTYLFDWIETADVPIDNTFKPCFERITVVSNVTQERAGCHFSVLKLGGRLITNSVHGLFSRSDAEVVARVTKHSLDYGIDMWRMVTEPSEPDMITGWASLEHPDHQVNENPSTCTDLVSLVASKRTVYGTGYGHGFKNWLGLQVIFEVIFLKPVSVNNCTNCYERVGCGQLWGEVIENAFDRAENQDFLLV